MTMRQETLQNLRFIISERKDKDLTYETQFDRYIERVLTYFNNCNSFNNTYLSEGEKHLYYFTATMFAIAKMIKKQPSVRNYNGVEEWDKIYLQKLIIVPTFKNSDETYQNIREVFGKIFEDVSEELDENEMYALTCALKYLNVLLKKEDVQSFISAEVEEKYGAVDNLPLVKNILTVKKETEKINKEVSKLNGLIIKAFNNSKWTVGASMFLNQFRDLHLKNMTGEDLEVFTEKMTPFHATNACIFLETNEITIQLTGEMIIGSNAFFNRDNVIYAPEVMPFMIRDGDVDPVRYTPRTEEFINIFNTICDSCNLHPEAKITPSNNKIPHSLNGNEYVYVSADDFINNYLRYANLIINSMEILTEAMYYSVLEIASKYMEGEI
jgi:hypothetical protein